MKRSSFSGTASLSQSTQEDAEEIKKQCHLDEALFWYPMVLLSNGYDIQWLWYPMVMISNGYDISSDIQWYPHVAEVTGFVFQWRNQPQFQWFRSSECSPWNAINWDPSFLDKPVVHWGFRLRDGWAYLRYHVMLKIGTYLLCCFTTNIYIYIHTSIYICILY